MLELIINSTWGDVNIYYIIFINKELSLAETSKPAKNALFGTWNIGMEPHKTPFISILSSLVPGSHLVF